MVNARDPRHDILFEHVEIGPKTLRNRFYASPQCSGFGTDRPGTQAYHRGLKAEGGFAVVHTEWCAIHPEADEWPAITGRLWDDDDLRNLALMVEHVHLHGALAGVQLGFNGAHTENLETRIAARGVTQVPSNTFVFHSCYEMTKREIRELQGFYASAARRACDVGFDVINLCANANAGIPQQFLMRAYNRRTDEYGGSLQNRTRFLREVVEEIRAAVEGECAVTVRLSIDTQHPPGLGIRPEEEAAAVVGQIDHLVDLWDFEVTGQTMAEWGESAGSSRFFEEGYPLALVRLMRPYTNKPVVSVGRFVSPDAMASAVRGGAIDVVGIARPGIADPFLPSKIEAGRLSDVRECIGCNICISRYEQKASIVCTQNATIGEEYRRGWHPERFTRAANAHHSVLVLGAGPAGMECAIVLGRRGFEHVHLVDGAPQLGGHYRWVSALPGLAEWRRLIDYRLIAIDQLTNVVFVPRKELTTEDVLDYGADIVIAATGSHWAGTGLNGFTHDVIDGADDSRAHILTPDQIMVDGKRPPGQRVVVYDCDGYFIAASMAELLADEGFQVTYVTPMNELAPYMVYTLENTRMFLRLEELGVTIVPQRLITSISPGLVSARHVHSEAVSDEWEADAAVLCTQRLSDDSLYRRLESDPSALEQAGIKALYRIGDCVVPRIAAEAVFDGHRLAREIDGANPAVARPFIRERRVIGAIDADYDGVLGGVVASAGALALDNG
jgi:dimethylamine/trimethylamine dehydrogenase